MLSYLPAFGQPAKSLLVSGAFGEDKRLVQHYEGIDAHARFAPNRWDALADEEAAAHDQSGAAQGRSPRRRTLLMPGESDMLDALAAARKAAEYLEAMIPPAQAIPLEEVEKEE